ncbi:glycosyltransferase involved in cell wall biosynthesis [Pseudomonas nitritireducens]|uniref:Glycosyltransferase involved in cell wall biosynthesis n=1 Tax=Pseudomonas nitroreducens TaxID=46680 RepID=A0A7W7KPY6_PSENT|nr:glycosyltransferase family 4 protein [Pseudomonas nitritireducens]MBB4866409.1 glycosyltransferase involved in cell wall biosynthesis [Pseudomonas nitritireducens]
MKNQGLFLIHLRGPINGAKVVSRIIHNNLKENYTFIDIASDNNERSTPGKFEAEKLFEGLIYTIRIFKSFITEKPKFIYFSFTPTGFAKLRDYAISIGLNLLGAKRIIYHFHAEFDLNKKPNLVDRFIFRNAEAICINPSHSRRIHQQTTIKEKNIHTIPNRILDRNEFNSRDFNYLIKRRLFSKKINILFFSNLTFGKGAEIAIEAFFKLKIKYQNATLTIAGKPLDPIYVNTLKSLCNREPEYAKDINFFGAVSKEDKYTIFRDASIFLFTSELIETFGLVNLEALSYGLPIVSLRTPASHYFIEDGRNGFIADSIGEVSEKLEILVDSAQLRRKMMSESIVKCQSFFIENFILEIKNAIDPQ